MINIADQVSGRFYDVFYEAMYFITNLITNCTRSQLRSLLSQDAIKLLIKCLDDRHADTRLIANCFEAIYKYLEYDWRSGLQGESSIKNFFEAEGGYDALLTYN